MEKIEQICDVGGTLYALTTGSKIYYLSHRNNIITEKDFKTDQTIRRSVSYPEWKEVMPINN